MKVLNRSWVPIMAIIAEHDKAPAAPLYGAGRLARKELREAIENHTQWLDSAGEAGARADLSGRNLEGADLVDARLPNALLHKANLKAADVTLADLRGATLVQANLAGATLLGTQLQNSSLQAANLLGATGLLGPQLAGTNVFGATLPDDVSPSAALKQVHEVARKADWLLCLTLLLDVVVGLRIFTTPDAQLVKNASAVPFSALQNALPYIPFYLFGPVVILSLYLCFHLYIQRLWDGIAQLPAIFPDGSRLDSCLPWYARWCARMHFHWLRSSQSPLAFLEAAFAIGVLYWIAPATILLFWARYLTLQDVRGTTLHILLVIGSAAAAANFPKLAGRAFAANTPRREPEPKLNRRTDVNIPRIGPPVFGLLLFLLSIGIFSGVPHGYRPEGGSPAPGVRAWAADILWTFGYNPFAQLTETDVSTKPRGWTAGEEDSDGVTGANLNRLRLRYIQGYGAFLVKARLWRTDLRNAYLSEADLREANLRQADLRFAVLDRARLAHAALPEADLRNANLDRADLRNANLSFTALSETTLLDATLDGANLYKSDLHSASLQRASLRKADLREANLEYSNLTMANLAESYLASTKLNSVRLKSANLSKAILTDADLRKADLSGALLGNAVLQGTDLTGANLHGADLRGAEGLTAAQVCAASSLWETQMDENLQQSVAALCPNKR
jgi:uncharacterized protein YjbI with pentapeptide repeats